MIIKEYKVNNSVGLHARPASVLTQLASKYDSNINIKKGDVNVNAKSILSLLSLGARKGDEIVIEVDGADQEIAMESIMNYLSTLGENE